MKSYRFTKSGILALPLPTHGNQKLYADPDQPGLAVRVTAGSRSFVVDKNTKRGRIRITLGAAGTDSLTLLHAREKARIALGLIAEGYGTNQIKDRLARVENSIPEGAVTLGQALEFYLTERKHKLAESTAGDYRRLVNTYLSDWQHRPLETINETAVLEKFSSINSASRANYTFRVVRAIFNYARSIKGEDGQPIVVVNPVEVLSQRRLWHTDKQRREVIELAELPAWWKAVMALGTEQSVMRDDTGCFAKGGASMNGNAASTRDFLQFLLLTGLRRNEAATLRWENVDMQSKMFTIPITKNRVPHTLPLSDFLYSMLKRRHATMMKDQDINPKGVEYVFSGKIGALGDPKKQIAKVAAISGVSFSPHTLRRTFASIAESLDIPYLALKRLLNHKAQDVTGKHYTVIGVERLRKPMQRITDFILRAAKVRKNAKIVKSKKWEKAA